MVIGTSAKLRDEDAIAFAAGFYEALGHGADLGAAFEFGRIRVRLNTVQVCSSGVMWPSAPASRHRSASTIYVRLGLEAEITNIDVWLEEAALRQERAAPRPSQ